MSYGSDNVKRWRHNSKSKMVEAMGGKCQCCGYDRHTSALAFHHLDPTVKELGFGGARANPKSWPVIVIELRKCVLVCNNCHSEIHAGIRELPDTYAVFNESYAEYRKISEYDECPICSNEKPVAQKYCSHSCAQKNSRKVDWDNIDLLDLMSKYGISEIENMLGV